MRHNPKSLWESAACDQRVFLKLLLWRCVRGKYTCWLWLFFSPKLGEMFGFFHILSPVAAWTYNLLSQHTAGIVHEEGMCFCVFFKGFDTFFLISSELCTCIFTVAALITSLSVGLSLLEPRWNVFPKVFLHGPPPLPGACLHLTLNCSRLCNRLLSVLRDQDG